MRNSKLFRTMFDISALCALLAVSACLNPPLEIDEDFAAQQYTPDGRRLVNLQINMGGGGGTIGKISFP